MPKPEFFGASRRESASPSGEIRSRQLLILAEKRGDTPTFRYQVDEVLKYRGRTLEHDEIDEVDGVDEVDSFLFSARSLPSCGGGGT